MPSPTQFNYDSHKFLIGLTKKYAAPEIFKSNEEEASDQKYNPFLADAYSLGLIALKMLNIRYKRFEIEETLVHLKEKLTKCLPLFLIIEGILQEDPGKRWDFLKITKFLNENENNCKFLTLERNPIDISGYCRKYQFENYGIESNDELLKLFEKHQGLYKAYNEQVTRPKEAKFHLDRLEEILSKLKEISPPEKKDKTISSREEALLAELVC